MSVSVSTHDSFNMVSKCGLFYYWKIEWVKAYLHYRVSRPRNLCQETPSLRDNMLEQLHQSHKNINKGNNRTYFTTEMQLTKAFCWQQELSNGEGGGHDLPSFQLIHLKLAKFIAQAEPKRCKNIVTENLGKRCLVKRTKMVI